jgi:hypothetical protein
MRRNIFSFFGCYSSAAVGIEVATESTKIKRIKNNMALVMKLKDKELTAQLGMVYMNIYIYEYVDTCDFR